MERMWYQQKKQYEIAKAQMQEIDRKCHDLKYQVAAMRHIENPTEREKNLKELEQSIRIYDSIVKTGNETLDTLLSEKSLICEARDITMHCVIDGKKLFFMDSIDIYALFGNAIDNAKKTVTKCCTSKYLIKSGGGTGPMKPRQPVFSRCQIRRTNRKMRMSKEAQRSVGSAERFFQ